jgi:hypothetical protein
MRTPGAATRAPPTRSTYARCELVRVSIVFWRRGSHPPHLAYVLRDGGAHAAPVRSYCFTVETELIGPAMLNGDNYEEFLVKYYPMIEEARGAVPQNHMQASAV